MTTIFPVSERDSNAETVLVLDPSGTILFASETFRELLDGQSMELTGSQLRDLAGEPTLAAWADLFEQVLARETQEQHARVPLQGPDGRNREWELTGRYHRKADGNGWIILTGRSVPDPKTTSRSEITIFVDRGTGKILEAAGNAETLTGRSREALLGMDHEKLYPPDDRSDTVAGVTRHAESGSLILYDLHLHHTNGKNIPVEFSAQIGQRDGRQVIEVTFRSLDHSAGSGRNLRLFQHVLQSLNEGICVTDLENRLLFINAKFEDIFGYRAGGILGIPASRIFTDHEQLDIDDTPGPEFLTADQWTGEITTRRNDGTAFPANLSKTVIRDGQNTSMGYIYIVQDLTGSKKVEEELIRAEKLRGLSTLAGGIAHDFNNILTSVLGNLSLAKLYGDDPGKLQTILERTEQAARKATGLTTQLLTFSKGGEPIQRQVEVRDLLRGALEFALSGSNVNYRLQLAKNIYPVSIDPDQMNQAVQNIIINAMQAMPDGGTIIVTAENVIMDQTNRVPGLAGRHYVRIRFTDQGVGIPEEALPRVFDPFYTTKASGSGLGLATTYSIVRRHKGAVSLESVPDDGTTVVMYLPAVITSEEKPVATAASLSGAPRGRVLVMDDESSIREVCTEYLNYLGFETVEAEDGETACRIYKEAHQAGDPFDVVIIDMTIPGGMGGQEAIRELLQYDKTVRAIVSSGYSTSPVMANYREHGFLGMVSKPYQLQDLKRVLEQVLA